MGKALIMLPTRWHGPYGTLSPIFLINGSTYGMKCNYGDQLGQPTSIFRYAIVDTGLLSTPQRTGSAYTISVRRRYIAILKSPRSNWRSASPQQASAVPIVQISFRLF